MTASAPRERQRWWWAAIGVGLAVIWTGPMRIMAKSDLLELRHHALQQVVANSYVLLALALLTVAAARLWPWRSSRRTTSRPLEHAPTVA